MSHPVSCRLIHLSVIVGWLALSLPILPKEDDYCGAALCERARCGRTDCQGAFILDRGSKGFHYDGHGAMSAGATSRLLYDYPEPQRSHILDYLFLPNFGASLHMLKVEIAGDSQSGYGTEPSHMHQRDDLSCERGCEMWLLREARRRNPGIVTYALAWAVPHWVGLENAYQSGYHGSDNIDYLIKWLQCVNQTGGGDVNYLGNRNEREWGPIGWTLELRAALDAAGFRGTRLILPDGEYGNGVVDLVVSNVVANASFANALAGGGVGLHYPCYAPQPEVQQLGFKYWSSEDVGLASDWNGAGCLGRTFNHHFVRMSITSVISRSLVWSVYPAFSHAAPDGFVTASEPWTGQYTVHDSVWVMAHTTQFIEVGWLIMDASTGHTNNLAKGGSYITTGASGYLRKGGSYVMYMSPQRDQFTLVVEKLHGRCRRCSGQETAEELVMFTLVGELPGALEDSFGDVAIAPGNGSNDTISAFVVQLDGMSGNNSSNDSSIAPSTNESTNVSFHESTDVSSKESGSSSNESINNQTINSSSRPLTLRFWLTNKTHQFIQLPDLEVDNATGSFRFIARPDTIYTVSTTRGQAHGLHTTSSNSGEEYNTSVDSSSGEAVPRPPRFPLPLVDDFDTYTAEASPRYFADYGGSWQVAPDPTMSGNMLLKQWVSHQALANQWVSDTDPISFVGDMLTNASVVADVYIPEDSGRPNRHAADTSRSTIQSVWNRLCLIAFGKAGWETTPVRQGLCTGDWDGQFSFDPDTGFITTLGGSKCVTARECPASIPTPQTTSRDTCPSPGEALCLMDCAVPQTAAARSRHGNQCWIWDDQDQAVRLRFAPSLCLTATGMQLESQLRLLPCAGPSKRQQWVAPGTAFAMYVGVCTRLAGPLFASMGRQRSRQGYCLNLGVDSFRRGFWQLEKNGTVVLARGQLTVPLGSWHRVELEARGPKLTVVVDGNFTATVMDRDYSKGMAAVNSGWGKAYIDNFAISTT